MRQHDTLDPVTITWTPQPDGEFAAVVDVSADHDRELLPTDLAAALHDIGSRPDHDSTRPIQVWVAAVQNDDDHRLGELVRPYRDLHQLRRPLPADPSGLITRSFDPDRDADEFILVNNRAFAWHPEQAGLNRERLAATMAEPWFNTDGFRILELDERIAGFCWTKVHHEETPPIGEIYVIAVDPDFHGRGLGGPMTLAGLEWLSSRGLTLANLYVESDNEPALATYRRLGFHRHSINRAYTTAPLS